MLKFLTHKLRTHSLNEENVTEKVEEHDSGTESDDEADRADLPPCGAPAPDGDFCTDVIMKWNDVTDISVAGVAGEACACAPAPLAAPAPEPDQLYDHHSSEEELEVINGAPASGGGAESRRRGASSPPPTAPEKRKWPDPEPGPPQRVPSDDEDDIKVETPVRFRTSPPLEALKPRRAGAAGCACAGGLGGAGGVSGAGGASGVTERVRAPVSPRRRRAQLPAPRRHRPALDFDKMQQLKVGGGVRSWRAVGGAHTGELSVFCW